MVSAGAAVTLYGFSTPKVVFSHSPTQPPRPRPDSSRKWLRRVTWCAGLSLSILIVSFALGFTRYASLIKSTTFISLMLVVALIDVLAWVAVTWKPPFARKWALSALIVGLLSGFGKVATSIELLPELSSPFYSVTSFAFGILGPVYLAIALQKYDFRFPVWPFVLLAMATPIFTALRFIEVPREFIGKQLMLASGIFVIITTVAWIAVLIYLKKSRPSRSNIASASPRKASAI